MSMLWHLLADVQRALELSHAPDAQAYACATTGSCRCASDQMAAGEDEQGTRACHISPCPSPVYMQCLRFLWWTGAHGGGSAGADVDGEVAGWQGGGIRRDGAGQAKVGQRPADDGAGQVQVILGSLAGCGTRRQGAVCLWAIAPLCSASLDKPAPISCHLQDCSRKRLI